MSKTDLHKLDEALDRWPLWQQPGLSRRPNIIDQLPGGLTNTSWLVETATGFAVVRVNSLHDTALNIDRFREKQIHRAAARAGLAPSILFCDLLNGILVTEYISGTIWQAESFGLPHNQNRVRQLLDNIQKIKLPLPKFDYWQHLCHYESCLKSLGASIPDELECRKKHHKASIEEFQLASWTPVLTHHDLQSGNVIEREGQLYVIDWEYAAMGYGGMDCQLLSCENTSEWAVIPLLQGLISDYWLVLKNQLTDQPI